MFKRWFLYLLILAGIFAFYTFYQGWIAWVLLALTAGAPWLSLVVSLVPMLLMRPSVNCPVTMTVDARERLSVRIQNPLPLPPCRCRFYLHHSYTGMDILMEPGDTFFNTWCGCLQAHCKFFYVYDYMGMFRLKLNRIPDFRILIRPREITMDPPPELERFLARSYKPKYGGGFSEQHEMRLYRPGDSMNQIHWKLTAKTGKLIVREPMIPNPGKVLLTMDLVGTPRELNKKMSRLLWISRYMAEQNLPHEIHVLTAGGLQILRVNSHRDATAAIDSLLTETPATSGTVLDRERVAAWRYHIGGDGDEA